MDNTYNLIIIGFIIAAFFVALWWAFNTVRRIEIQKGFCAIPLTSIAKLWRKANFVPEDAKERESLYLYRDFLRKFDESECKYPVMVKNGKVRAMTRKEYDDLCGQKQLRVFSPLLAGMALLLAVVALAVNFFVTGTPLVGVGLALILPAVEIALGYFVGRFNKDKNNYRDGIFMALKDNSIAFLSITKPFIIVDAYPEKFGKNAPSLYATIGELSDAQIAETRDFIVRQKSAETEVVMRNVDNRAEIEQMEHPTVTAPAADAPAEPTAPVDDVPAADDTAADTMPNPQDGPSLSPDEKAALIEQLIDDHLAGEAERAINKDIQNAVQTNAPTPAEPADKPADKPADDADANLVSYEAPAEDDFSWESIGKAFDAAIDQLPKNFVKKKPGIDGFRDH